MTSILIRGSKLETQRHREEGHVKAEAENGEVLPQAKEHQRTVGGHQSQERARDRFSFRACRRNPPSPQPDCGLLTSGTVTELIPACFKRTPPPRPHARWWRFVTAAPGHLHTTMTLRDPVSSSLKWAEVLSRTPTDGKCTRRHNNKLFLLLESDSWRFAQTGWNL